MKGFVAALVVLSMLGASMAFAGLASAQERDLMPVVETGSTDRLGGGDWITVRAGGARGGGGYGTIDKPNKGDGFSEDKRCLGGVDIYDAEGNYLATRNLPVFTIFGQSMDALIEFEDRSGDGLLNFRALNVSGLNDVPVKASRLVTAWSATEPTTEVVGETTWVNFTVYTGDLGYGLVWDRAVHEIRPGTPDDGAVERIAVTVPLRGRGRRDGREVRPPHRGLGPRTPGQPPRARDARVRRPLCAGPCRAIPAPRVPYERDRRGRVPPPRGRQVRGASNPAHEGRRVLRRRLGA